MQLQQQPCNRDEIEEVVRLLLGHPTSPYVHHPTLFINNSPCPSGSATVVDEQLQGEDAVSGTPRREGGEEETEKRVENRETNQNNNKNQCDEFFKKWMEKQAIEGSPTAEVIETNPLQKLLEHYKEQSNNNKTKSNKKKENGMMLLPNDPTTLVVKRYRRSGIHASAIPLGERAVYVCAQLAVEDYINQHIGGRNAITARSIFPQLFLPLFVTTITGSEDLRDTSTSTTPVTKKRKKSAITAAVKSLKPSFSAPDFPTNTSSPVDGIMTEDSSNEPQSWPNLLRATGISPTPSLLNPPSKSPLPNTVVMAKYCGSLTTLLSLAARASPLRREDFVAALKKKFSEESSSKVYCRELCRQPVLEYKVLVSILYLITRGLIQIHNLAQGQMKHQQQQEEGEGESPPTSSIDSTSNSSSPPTIGFVHNDLRLPNILLSNEGNVGLVDFELATRIVVEDGTPKLCTKSKQEAGNHEKFVGFSYLPPDGVPCDVWTLGIVALDLLTGCHTFFIGDYHLPSEALQWSDGPTPIRTEVNNRLEVLHSMTITTTSSATTNDTTTTPPSIQVVEEGSPLDAFLADCFTWIPIEEPSKRLQMLYHPSEGICSNSCLCSHKLFTSTLQVSTERSMEEEAMMCIRGYFTTNNNTPPSPAPPITTTSD